VNSYKKKKKEINGDRRKLDFQECLVSQKREKKWPVRRC